MAECPTVVQLQKFQTPASQDTTCLEILDLFLGDQSLLGVPIVDEANRPISLINRQLFVECFTQPYAREVHGKKKAVQFLKSNSIAYPTSPPIIVDESTAIDDVAQMIIGAGMQHMVTGFIVTREGAYLGVADGHSLLNEITRRKQSDLFYLAHYDQLTGLPNRMLFGDRLKQAGLDAERSGFMMGLMFVDIDRFKQVNDTLGHGVGDLLLRAVSARLKHCARESDTVGRLGGDEFAILMDNIKQPSDPEVIAQRIIHAMRKPVAVAGQSLSITVSIGVAIYPTDDSNVTGLLAKADAAMYEAKTSGRNGFRSYVPGLLMFDPDQMILEAGLRHAVERQEFLLYYQPKVSLSDNSIVGVEALIRWRHASRGLISPAYFIPLAEESGIIIEMGTWVLREACRQHCRWRDAGLPAFSMAINISPLQFRQENFVALVQSIIAETGIDPQYIELEMTEGTLMLNAATVLETLQQLKDIGVRLAIDDFGTGYSNLSYLKNFPIDCIKIDQSFVKDIHSSAVNQSIVRAIVSMASCLSMTTVAEGVENHDELDIIRQCQCENVQGYHFAKPLAAGEFAVWQDSFQAVLEGDVDSSKDCL